MQNGSSNPSYVSSGGNPGGHIRDSDSEGGIAWYYAAPLKFLGSREVFYEGTLSFDLRQDDDDDQFDGNPDTGGDVALTGENTTLVCDFGGADENPGTDWTGYNVPPSAAHEWLNVDTDQPPTRTEFESVLSGLDSLWIRGEYRSGADRSYLDTVVMTAPEPPIAEIDGATEASVGERVEFSVQDASGNDRWIKSL